MSRYWPSGPSAAFWLRRAVVAIGAAALLALPQFTTKATFLGVPGLPGPLVVLGVGLVFWMMPILLAASWVAEGRAVMPHPWLAVPAGLFVAGSIISTYFASDKSSAMARAAEMSGLWMGLFALVQALRSDAERRFLLAALVASGLVAAGVGIYEAGWGLQATWEEFQAHRERVLAEYGIAPGSWMEQAFIGRFFGGAQAGLGHPNVLAAFLTLATLVAAGLVREKWTEAATRGARAVAVAVGAMAAVCAAALILTQGRAGEAAFAVGLYWLAVSWRVRRRNVRRALYAAPLVLAAVVLAVASQVGHPAVVEFLRSLRYRLDYWQATAGILWGHGLAGVGLENFGLHYVEHKLPWAPEEVGDPHNMILSTWSKTGLAGLAALVMFFVIAVRGWLAGGAPTAKRDGAPGEPLLDLLAPALLVAAPAVIALFFMGWLPGVAALGAMTLVVGLAASEEPSQLEAAGRPLRSLRTACIVAVLAFVLQEQIGTSVLEPPTAWAMLVVIGVTLGPGRMAGGELRSRGPSGGASSAAEGTPPPGVPLRAPVKFLLLASAMVVGFLYVSRLVLPVGREGAMLDLAASVDDKAERDEALQAAGAANPWAWEPAVIRGQFWQAEASRAEGPADAIALERAMEAYRNALARQPRLRRAYLALASCHLTMPGAMEDVVALAAARGYLEQAARLYPTDLPTQLRLADVIDRLGDSSAALAAYRETLRLDYSLPDPGRRLRPDIRRAVENRIGELSQERSKPPAAP